MGTTALEGHGGSPPASAECRTGRNKLFLRRHGTEDQGRCGAPESKSETPHGLKGGSWGPGSPWRLVTIPFGKAACPVLRGPAESVHTLGVTCFSVSGVLWGVSAISEKAGKHFVQTCLYNSVYTVNL